MLALVAGWLIALRRGVVTAIVGAGALGIIAALAEPRSPEADSRLALGGQVPGLSPHDHLLAGRGRTTCIASA